MSELRKASKDVLIYMVVNLIPIFLGFISIPIFTRLLDPSQYGQMSIVNMTSNYTVIFMLSWVSSSFLRFYEHYKKKGDTKYFINTYLILLFGVVLTSLLLYSVFLLLSSLFGWFDSDLLKLFALGSGLLFFNGLLNFIRTYYRTRLESVKFAIVSIANSLFTLLSGLVFVLIFHYGVAGIIFGSALVSGVISLVAIFFILRKNGGFRLGQFDRAIVKEGFSYGAPVIFSSFAAWILRFSDRYIIEFTRGTSEVGLYSVSYNLSEKTISLIITAIALAVSPILIASWERSGKKKTERLLWHFSRYQFMLLLPGTLGLILLAPQFIKYFVGPQYQEGILASQIVAMGIFFSGLYNLTATGLYVAKKTNIIARNNLIVGLFNILLNLLLVPRYGYIAAAVNTVVTYILLWLVSYFQTRSILKWGIATSSFIKMTFSAFAMSVFLYFSLLKYEGVPQAIIISILAATFYFMILYALGELSKESLLALEYIKKRIFGNDKRDN